MFIGPARLCAACGAPLAPQDLYCEECGHARPPAPDQGTLALMARTLQGFMVRVLCASVAVLTATILIVLALWLLSAL